MAGTVAIVATWDTKGTEMAFLEECAAAGVHEVHKRFQQKA
jgi:uncharacterized protein (UPF0261 family)